MDKGTEYDVVLSFAGEDRLYVEEVARYLEEQGVAFFYDRYEEAELWGKDLYEHLDDVYQRHGRYCVMFLSQHYARKLWTTHERRSAQARAFEEQEEYILPVRLDDTEIPGVRRTIGWIDARTKSPRELCQLILQKLGRSSDVPEGRPRHRVPKIMDSVFNPYQLGLDFIATLRAEIVRRCGSLAAQGVACTVFDREGRTCLRVVRSGRTAYSLDVWLGGLTGDSSLGFYGRLGEAVGIAGSSNAWGTFEQGEVSAVLKFNDLSLLQHFGGERVMTQGELIDAIWERICDALEQDARR